MNYSGCDNCGRLNHKEEECPEPKNEVRRNPTKKCLVCQSETRTQQNRYCSIDCADTDGECCK